MTNKVAVTRPPAHISARRARLVITMAHASGHLSVHASRSNALWNLFAAAVQRQLFCRGESARTEGRCLETRVIRAPALTISDTFDERTAGLGVGLPFSSRPWASRRAPRRQLPPASIRECPPTNPLRRRFGAGRTPDAIRPRPRMRPQRRWRARRPSLLLPPALVGQGCIP